MTDWSKIQGSTIQSSAEEYRPNPNEKPQKVIIPDPFIRNHIYHSPQLFKQLETDGYLITHRNEIEIAFSDTIYLGAHVGFHVHRVDRKIDEPDVVICNMEVHSPCVGIDSVVETETQWEYHFYKEIFEQSLKTQRRWTLVLRGRKYKCILQSFEPVDSMMVDEQVFILRFEVWSGGQSWNPRSSTKDHAYSGFGWEFDEEYEKKYKNK